MYLPSKKISLYKIGIFASIVLLILHLRGTLQSIFLVSLENTILVGRKYRSEINRLKREKLNLYLQVKRMKSLKEENERLKRALHFKKDTDIDLILGFVVGFEPSNWRRIAFVNVGKREKIKEGMYVVDENGYVVGKVYSVGEHFSQVEFLNDPDFSLYVFIGSNNRGLLKGTLGGKIKVMYMEKYKKVSVGDKVWVESIVSHLPLEIGKVCKVSKEDNSLFLDIEVQPSSKLFSSQMIFILREE